MSFHVAAYAKGLAASRLWALVWLLTRMAVAVDAQAAWARKGLVASRADVAVLWLGELRLARRADVVVVLPRVGAVGGRAGNRYWQRHRVWLEVGRQRTLGVQLRAVVRVLLRRVERGRRGGAG